MNRSFEHLTPEQVNGFLTDGYVVLHDCFDREFAEHLTAHAFVRLGYDPSDRSTWGQKRVHMPNVQFFPMETFAPKAWNAACELLGGEERVLPATMSDGFIVNFGIGTDRPWIDPGPDAPGWHKDGGFFRHYLDSPEQGLLTLVLWSDVAHQGGATFVASDSIGPVARYLVGRPEGTILSEFNFGPLVQECGRFVEMTGGIGDIVLLHPFMLHAASQNLSGKARFLTNPPIALREPMNFNRPDANEFSLVELAILRGLGLDRLDHRIGGPRERVHAEYERVQARLLEEERARLAEHPSPQSDSVS